jgi:DNA-binding transcriptional ArsR family regulator
MSPSIKKKKLLKATEMLKLLSHPVRLSILCDLIEQGEMNAGDIVAAEQSRASQSQVSQYLAEFRRRKLVNARKEGQQVFYTIAAPDVKAILKTLHDIYC